MQVQVRSGAPLVNPRCTRATPEGREHSARIQWLAGIRQSNPQVFAYPMSSLRSFLLPLLLIAALPTVGDARPRENDQAWAKARRGAIMPLPRIEDGIVPGMQRRGATYLGPEFDAGTGTYRLKFMRGGKVTWVDVDARTGRVLGTAE